VIYRLPEGKSIVTPPSSCPHCGYRLAWYDNVPVAAWFWLGGKCRKCKAPISFQYPLIEAMTALLFGGLFAICYYSPMRPDFGRVEQTWPVFTVYVVMFAGLLAATVIDARLFIIPLSIPWLITLVALVAYPLTVVFLPQIDGPLKPMHTHGPVLGMALGGMVGLAAAIGLLWRKVIPRSFDDPSDYLPSDDPEAFLAHPHPRRETLKECLFLAWPIAGAVGGYWLVKAGLPSEDGAPAWLTVLGGVLLGYLAGGLTVWATRVLGTLGFGKEAMGLGDVHLLAAVGAVCGWPTAVLVFFVAPFLGLSYTVVALGVGKVLKREVRIIPYGPHLAAATLIVVIFRGPLMVKFGMLLGN
jgi:leader peptidase (prepilin peptidase)/N-methyltransferase